VGIIMVLLAASFAFYRVGGRMAPRKLGSILIGTGGGVVLGGFVGPWGFSFSPLGISSMRGFLGWVIVGLVLTALGFVLRTVPGEKAKDQSIPVLGVVLVAMVGILVFIWTMVLPVPAKIDGVQTVVFDPIAMTTRIPWTVLAVIVVAIYWASWFLRDRISTGAAKTTLIALWVVSFPVIVLVILRDPDVDYGRAFTWYLPIAVAFIVVGGLILNFVAGARGEAGHIVAAVLLIIALGSFLIPMEFVLRFLLVELNQQAFL